jgi:hypothetical protein
MQIPVETFAFIVLPVAMALFVAMLVTHDRVGTSAGTKD